ncbi:hypothetical protein OSTOST_12645, partial [Ostertagia ostertagi]
KPGNLFRSHAAEGEPISIINAILLPGVLAYCLCNACLKLVNYAFFFWLPLYLTEAYHWEETKDKMGCRAPLIVAMLICSIGSLFVYARIGANVIWNAFFMTVVGVTISGPYNLIVGTISIDLGSQPILASNAQAMSTVSGLLDGTGSAGSAVGQLFVPIMQASFGWQVCVLSLHGVERPRNRLHHETMCDGPETVVLVISRIYAPSE